ncbi:hypothetical protein FRC07_006534 [Ceratobasidium sp. 392]|nr:hypothetical protein FRC07_006534 [Ceratobasidium sp. 392]
MSVATEPQPHSILAWSALRHSKPVNGSCSGESNSTSSSSVMPASTSSSGRSSGTSGKSSQSSNRPLPSPTIHEVSPTTSWTSGTFSFPPCSDRTLRSLPLPSQKSTPNPSASTSRLINRLPGFDELAELVMASGASIPHLTITPASSRASQTPKSTIKTRPPRFGWRAVPSEPKPIVTTPPTPTTSLPWTGENEDDGRVTFIFGRLKPARVRYSAPPPQTVSTSLEPSPTAATTTIFSRNPSLPPPIGHHADSRPAELA